MTLYEEAARMLHENFTMNDFIDYVVINNGWWNEHLVRIFLQEQINEGKLSVNEGKYKSLTPLTFEDLAPVSKKGLSNTEYRLINRVRRSKRRVLNIDKSV
jgi:hypothetical protein